MAEFDAIYSVAIPIVVGSAIAALGWLMKGRERKDSVEKKAVDKGVIERGMAKELKENAEKIAATVKEETMAAVNQLFATLRSEIKLHDQEIASEMKARDVRINQNRDHFVYFIDNIFKEFKENILAILEKQNKTIEMLQTLSFGPDAHSFPHYIMGEEKTFEDANKPDEGMFNVQSDESRDKQTSDNEERIRQDEDDKKGY